MTTLERIEKAEKELSELKALALKEKEEKEFKVGDWVAYMESGWQEVMKSKYNVVDNVYKIKELNDGYIYVEGYGERSNAERTNFRKATEEEIKTHLISEAEKKGFVKGAKVNLKKGQSRKCYASCGFKFTDCNWTYGQYGKIIEDIEISNCNTVVIRFSCDKNLYIDIVSIELAPVYPSIEINGYKAEFKEWGISFNHGCADIAKEIFIDLANILNKQYPTGNRAMEYVTIGKGVFSASQIIEIANHFTK